MCGIAGYFSKKNVPTINIDKCLEILKKRGPDDHGTFYKKFENFHAGLIHTRLSILDLDSRSAQPFYLERFVFSYNGEIYNFFEVRDKLQKLGYKFQTSGDTEVLAVAWLEWGVEALNKFDGMWAFAVYDTLEGKLTLSTDPFGEKPLFFSKDKDGSVFFASKLECIFQMTGKKPKLNLQHLQRYLINGYKNLYKVTDCFVEDIISIPGNTIIEISKKGVKFGNYWKRPEYDPDFSISRNDLIIEVKESLIQSVSRRMRSDVPLAFCMSGGVDSNSIIAIAAKELGLPVKGFTIINQDGRYDESELVEISSKSLEIENEKIELSPVSFLDSLQSMVAERFGPVATISYYTQNFLLKAISERGFKVSISGTGADELFTGYYDHHLLYLASKFLKSSSRLKAISNWEEFVRPLTRNPLLQDAEKYSLNPLARDHIYYRNEFYSEFLRQPWSEAFKEETYCSSLLRNRMMNELYHEAVPVILKEDDTNAMSYSVENRSPFLSRDLLDISMKIPDEHLIQKGFAKSILREAMEGLVPERILWERRKTGFNSSLFEVANIESESLREAILDRTSFYEIIDRDKVESFLKKDLSLNSDSKFLFNLINAKLTTNLMET